MRDSFFADHQWDKVSAFGIEANPRFLARAVGLADGGTLVFSAQPLTGRPEWEAFCADHPWDTESAFGVEANPRLLARAVG